MKNHKIFKKYKDALSYANDLIDGIKGEVLFDDAWNDYLINGENTGDCKLYKNGKFIKTITIDDNYKWSNLIMLYKKDDGFMVYTNFEFDESKKSARKSIKEASESVIIDGKKTNFKINDYGTFFSEKIKYMLIGEPLENEDVLTDFLEENSNFEFEEYKIPYSTVYYIYNDEKSLFGVAYRHYIRLTNDEKDAKIMLAYATDKRDLYNGL